MRVIVLACLLAAATQAAAQDPAARPVPPSADLFGRLFPANRECSGCEARPGRLHVVFDSPRLTEAWLARHHYQANGGPFGDNAAVADFWYDAVHRRLVTRSLLLHEVDDPADLRLGRAPGVYPNDPDFTATLAPGTTVGHVGFVGWNDVGFGSYFAAVQGAVRDAGTGYLDLATATGAHGTTRTGSRYAPDDLIKHVRLHPSGELELGFETDPEARPERALLVRGDAQIEGTLTVGGVAVAPGAPALSCRVRTAAGSGRVAAAHCEANEVAIGGGGTCGAGELRGSRPAAGDEPGHPGGWELTCSRNGAHAVSVICCAR